MIAAWMIYCAVATAIVSVAAIGVERVLLHGRAPVRLVWILAIALSTLMPFGIYQFAPRRVVTEPASADVVADHPLVDASLPQAANVPVVAPPRERVPQEAVRDWTLILARLDTTVVYVWGVLSFALACNFLGGIMTLAWMRQAWRSHTVLGVPVFVSENAGPAVVGVLTPLIVIPKWVLSLDERQLALLLKHEQEHRRAGDGQIVTLARLALIAMPWNLALWYQMQRLRVAIELDCDARVLQNADARTYGDLLLNVAHRPSSPSLAGATAFAERATQLERRIQHLPRHRRRTTSRALFIAASVALVTIAVACVAPHPAVPTRRAVRTAGTPIIPVQPSRSSGSVAKMAEPRLNNNARDSDATIRLRRELARSQSLNVEKRTAIKSDERDSTKRKVSAEIGRAPARDSSQTYLRMATKRGDTTETHVVQTAGPTSISEVADSIFRFLFAGVALTPNQQLRAHLLLKQMDAGESLVLNVGRLTGSLRERQTRQAQRDSSLRALLTSDPDRALFDAHASVSRGGARGRVGGAGVDTSGLPRSMPGGGGGGGVRSGGARGGGPGGGRGGRGSSPDAFTSAADGIFRRFFEGITLTSEQTSAATQIIAAAQNELAAMPVPPITWDAPRSQLPALVRLDSASAYVLMRPSHETALLDVLQNDVDRARVRARIAVVRQ